MTASKSIDRLGRITAAMLVGLLAGFAGAATARAEPSPGHMQPNVPGSPGAPGPTGAPHPNVPSAPNAPDPGSTQGAAPQGAASRGALHEGVATDVPPPDGTAPLVAQELEILKKLHEDNRMEIAMGRAAAARGSSSAVKAFGRRLVADHTSADKKIADYLKAKKLDPSVFTAVKGDPPEEHVLADHTGQDFDRAFAQKMIDAHQEAIERVTKVQERTTDPKLKALLKGLLPTLQKHLKAARSLANATGSAPNSGHT